jgi:hypothetical protein
MMYVNSWTPIGDQQVYLTHKPSEARMFATAAEAEAARGHAEAYVKWERYEKSSSPRACGLEVVEIHEATLLAAFPDGSGLASDYLREAMSHLRRYEDHCATLRAFIQRYQARLDGTSWSCDCYYDHPLVRLGTSPFAMKGEYVTAETMALLWPEAQWKRRKHDYAPPEFVVHDWRSHLDGVDLIIASAESVRIRPVDTGRDGELVKLRKEVSA